ncbi:cytidine deaminase [Candidatus Entotheonella palauensis]|uniref:CMP/dCMP-type deaminase domain-containing protein n=1 Tax=Candidatus Entotheonella gemina TaxID=1429439 RepID=W4MC27_9BACT|nr:cytidine deaminase [Candidatus Entotheonella palauensis]ETX07197.1 MAG: hypothetical protein ETSY2_12595 [Candidatus Entotheonella gemina]
MAAQENAFESALAVFPETVRTELKEVLDEGPVIPAERAASWIDHMSTSVGQLMIWLLPVAASYARVPISNYHVGAVAQGMPRGNSLAHLYLGSNVEFSGQALSFTVHGEQCATNNAWLHGETGLQALAINAAPCGYCRQFLYELTTAKSLNILLKANTNPNDYSYTTNPLTYFLPQAFGPSDLGLTGGLMESESHGLTISSGSNVAQTALQGANASYAPYTKDYAGVALQQNNQTIYVGRYAENAAYNPSMSPLESALALMNMFIPPQAPLNITAAALVEAQADISQKSATEATLASIAPGVTLEHVVAS